MRKIFATKKYFYFLFKKNIKNRENREKLKMDAKKSRKITEGVLLCTL